MSHIYSSLRIANQWVSARRRNCSALAVVLRLSCINPSKWHNVYEGYNYILRSCMSVISLNLITEGTGCEFIRLESELPPRWSRMAHAEVPSTSGTTRHDATRNGPTPKLPTDFLCWKPTAQHTHDDARIYTSPENCWVLIYYCFEYRMLNVNYVNIFFLLCVYVVMLMA